MSDEVTFPKDRDIYASGEVASAYFGIPISGVNMLHMKRAAKALMEQGVIKKIFADNGRDTQVPWPWPGVTRLYSLYSVRNHDKYKDLREVMKHLAGVQPPPDTNFSARKREAIGRKRRENAIKYGKLGPKIER